MERSLTFAQFEQIFPQLGFKQEGSDYIGPCPVCGSPRQYYRGFEQGEGVLVSIPMGNSRSTCRCSQNDIEQAMRDFGVWEGWAEGTRGRHD